jgi:hypothetical protein
MASGTPHSSPKYQPFVGIAFLALLLDPPVKVRQAEVHGSADADHLGVIDEDDAAGL